MPAARSFRQDTRSEEYRLSRRSKVPRAPGRSFALSASARMRCLYSAVKIRRLALATTWGSGRGCVKNAFFGARCRIRDEGGPFGVGVQAQASNSRKLLPSNDSGGERYGKGVMKSRHVWVRETNASEPLMRPRNRSTDGIKTGAPPLSGKSMAETWLLAMRCPGYRWRDSSLGSGMELENLFGGEKGKGTSGSPCEAESTDAPDSGGLSRSSE